MNGTRKGILLWVLLLRLNYSGILILRWDTRNFICFSILTFERQAISTLYFRSSRIVSASTPTPWSVRSFQCATWRSPFLHKSGSACRKRTQGIGVWSVEVCLKRSHLDFFVGEYVVNLMQSPGISTIWYPVNASSTGLRLLPVGYFEDHFEGVEHLQNSASQPSDMATFGSCQNY